MDYEKDPTLTKSFIGTARVRIDCLQFDEGRQVDSQSVKRLLRLFEETKCQRYNPDHYVPAIVNLPQLKRILRASKLNRNALKVPSEDGTWPFLNLEPSHKLICVHGKHRIRAAELFLDPDDRWWTVRLFLESLDGV